MPALGSPADSAAFLKQGFTGAGAACRRRVELRMWQAARATGAGGWAIGLFNAARGLVAFDTSGGQVGLRGVLAQLHMVPLPESLGPVDLKPGPPYGDEIQPALGASVKAGESSSVVIVLVQPRMDGEARWESIEAAQTCAPAVAHELADFAVAQEKRGEIATADASPQAFFLLSPVLDVQVAWYGDDDASRALAELVQPRASRLPLFLERAVRRMTFSWNFSTVAACAPGMAHPLTGLSLRVVPMMWQEVSVGVFLSTREDSRHVDAVAATFGISPRELQVVHELLDGRSVAEIAQTLRLAESTVNDHIARMIAKTNARNRTEMAATLLGWPAMKESVANAGMPSDETEENGQRNAGRNGR